jgi:hypothetical protein
MENLVIESDCYNIATNLNQALASTVILETNQINLHNSS